jgi:hypothetical protein
MMSGDSRKPTAPAVPQAETTNQEQDLSEPPQQIKVAFILLLERTAPIDI